MNKRRTRYALWATVVALLFTVIAPGGAPQASALGGYTIDQCVIPGGILEDMGYQTAQAHQGWNSEDYDWVAGCFHNSGEEPAGYFFAYSVNTNRAGEIDILYPNMEYEYVNIKMNNPNYVSAWQLDGTYGATGYSGTASWPAGYTTGAGSYFPLSKNGLSDTNWTFNATNITNKSQLYIDSLIELPEDNAVSNDYTPKLLALNVKDKKVTGSFCMNTEQCEWPEGYNGISWRIYNSSDEVLFNSTEQEGVPEGFIELNFSSYGEYRLEADYTSSPPFLPGDNVNVHTLKLPFPVDGSTYATGSGEKFQNCTDQGVCEAYNTLDPCLMNEPPFISWEGRKQNIDVVARLLSFQTIKFSNSWVQTGDCRTLTTLGSWIGKEGQVVCAQFPASIRNIVTPFVTFAIGLAMISFISRKTGAGI